MNLYELMGSPGEKNDEKHDVMVDFAVDLVRIQGGRFNGG